MSPAERHCALTSTGEGRVSSPCLMLVETQRKVNMRHSELRACHQPSAIPRLHPPAKVASPSHVSSVFVSQTCSKMDGFVPHNVKRRSYVLVTSRTPLRAYIHRRRSRPTRGCVPTFSLSLESYLSRYLSISLAISLSVPTLLLSLSNSLFLSPSLPPWWWGEWRRLTLQSHGWRRSTGDSRVA